MMALSSPPIFYRLLGKDETMAESIFDRVERLNKQINELENSYGRGPFYDGAIRDRLKSLWDERDVLIEAARAMAMS